MKYQPLTAVWEVTMGCNMRCGHCGSSCKEPLEDELSTEEAFSLIDDIAELGLKWVTLSGGEPLTRKDLPELIKRLKSRKVHANIITNGWMLNEKLVAELKESGVSTIAISLDGTEKIHDSIRKEGSFKHVMNAFKLLKEAGITTGTVTTVSRKNLEILPQMREVLIEAGVESWQLQLGLPMGNFKKQPDWLISPEQVNEVIDFCYETSMKGDIIIYPADCIGYYTEKETQIRRKSYKINGTPMWEGCNAGTRGFGILQNGDILGCTSIRNPEFIEGNVKKTRLRDIWENPDGFTWRRQLKKTDLSSDCSICTYGSKCLGGCPNTRLTMEGSIYSENRYCSYNLALKAFKKALSKKDDTEQLYTQAEQKLQDNNFQEAAFIAERIIELDPKHKDALNLKGFAEFMCGNYALCEAANKAALDIDPTDTYAMKGLGLALHKQGKSSEGIRYVEKAAKLTGYADRDIMNDLYVIKREAGMTR